MDPRIYADMQTESPFRIYRKTILGKIYVSVINPFTGSPEGIVLEGKKDSESSTYKIWSEMEDVYFKRANRRHFELGNVIEVVIPKVNVEEVEKPIEQYTDGELIGILNTKYASLQKTLRETNTEAVLLRLLQLAEENNKTEKTVASIKSRLSAVQLPVKQQE